MLRSRPHRTECRQSTNPTTFHSRSRQTTGRVAQTGVSPGRRTHSTGPVWGPQPGTTQIGTCFDSDKWRLRRAADVSRVAAQVTRSVGNLVMTDMSALVEA